METMFNYGLMIYKFGVETYSGIQDSKETSVVKLEMEIMSKYKISLLLLIM